MNEICDKVYNIGGVITDTKNNTIYPRNFNLNIQRYGEFITLAIENENDNTIYSVPICGKMRRDIKEVLS